MRLPILLPVLLTLVLVSCEVPAVHAHDFTWRNLLMASIKLRENFDAEANVDSYLQVFRPDVWNRYRNNEFELAAKREETLEIMKKEIQGFDLSEDFYIRANLQFGAYEFKTLRFPIAGLGEDSYYYENQYNSGSFPSSFKMFFKNPTLLSGIDMPEAQAKEFLRTRTDRYGDVNRRLYARISIRVVKLKSDVNELLGEIQSAKIYADDKHTILLAEFKREDTSN